jgi:hypothetical protein
VPKIALYEVREITRILAEAGFSEPFVWLDLFCIPQDISVDWQAAICKAELPLQAEIFQNTGTAAAWLYDVPCWTRTKAVVSWLSMRHLKSEWVEA